jgi:hypothetical protein
VQFAEQVECLVVLEVVKTVANFSLKQLNFMPGQSSFSNIVFSSYLGIQAMEKVQILIVIHHRQNL